MTSSGPWRPPGDQAGSSGDAPADDGAGGQATPPPENIHTAWVLWLAASAFGVVGMVLNALTTRFGDIPVATRDAIRDAAEGAGESAPPVETLFTTAMTIGAGLALLAAAVTVWFAFRLRAGKGWARLMLDIVAIFLMVDGLSVVISVFGGLVEASSRGEIVTFVVFSCQILAALCAATAVWRQHSAEAMEYTGGGARARG